MGNVEDGGVVMRPCAMYLCFGVGGEEGEEKMGQVEWWIAAGAPGAREASNYQHIDSPWKASFLSLPACLQHCLNTENAL